MNASSSLTPSLARDLLSENASLQAELDEVRKFSSLELAAEREAFAASLAEAAAGLDAANAAAAAKEAKAVAAAQLHPTGVPQEEVDRMRAEFEAQLEDLKATIDLMEVNYWAAVATL